MSLLNFDDSRRPRPKLSLKWLLSIGISGALAATSVTYAIYTQINGNDRFNYGQGTVQSTTCDNTVTLTPYASFQNQANGGKFTLDSVYLEGISQNCIGHDFIIRVFDDSNNAPISITDSGSGTTYTGARIWFKDSKTFQVMGTGYIDSLAVNESISAGQEQSVQIVFDADALASFADAKQIYKVTVESATHDGNAA